ncbi:hypothetical protein GWR56_11030 [Mucilaginibacter sp. 14171R-50]|uniref:hypothetical protein n=1 Tax=Mucilaginibacter sp. 14171R-50 TaxID=2703789 RepID=UPI00138BC246|nr:hypothetical protein [Mucilaginibacter sp. 14171R-50]QHS56042.1 hypothetical protein GWR56_11030 [Mucilaginibacter sp. 14171R-50]
MDLINRTINDRIEWKGDFFKADLPIIMSRLQNFQAIARPFSHTVTLFYKKPDANDYTHYTLRVRAYANLHCMDPAAVLHYLNQGITGKIQFKKNHGEKTELGDISIASYPGESLNPALHQISIAGKTLVLESFRLSRRAHWCIEPDGICEERELNRITLDFERYLYVVNPDKGLVFLGEMGPRLEIKSPTNVAVELVLALINRDGLMKEMNYRSLELLLQHKLTNIIPQETGKAFPEIEAKFDIATNALITADDLMLWLQAELPAGLLLPSPSKVVRMRRYHICRDAKHASTSCTLVETAAQKYSPKIKNNAYLTGQVLVRTTQASRTTDRNGTTGTMQTVLESYQWKLLNSFEKTQVKIPFQLSDGFAYLLSIDDCIDTTGNRLQQLEIEFIGSALNVPQCTEAIFTDINRVVTSLLTYLPFRGKITPSKTSKHEYFARYVPVPRVALA